jgi:hypothetical protein
MCADHASEIRRAIERQPVATVQRFAELLGWRGLRVYGLYVADLKMAVDESPIVIYYMTTDEKFNLQINCHPHCQQRQFRATVKAERYGICNVGWHDFELDEHAFDLPAVVDRLRPYLQRSSFKDRRWRRALKTELERKAAACGLS